MDARIVPGRIVWAELGPRGRYKRRPCLIVTPPDADGTFNVAGGSTQFDETHPRPIDVELLSSGVKKPPPGAPQPNPPPTRHPLTKLKWRTVVDCKWIVPLVESKILQYGGTVPPTTLSQVVAKVRS